MYMGEVNVAQEELNSFLSVAEDLRVKGLTQNNSSSEKQSLPKPEPTKHIVRPRDPPEREPIAPPNKRPRPPVPSPQQSAPFQSFRAEDDDIQEVVPVKSEPRDPAPMSMPVAQIEQPQVYHHTQDQSMVEEQHEQGTVALDESYDYGQYEGYDDSSGMVDTSGMAMGAADGNKGLTENDVKATLEQHMQKLASGTFICLLCNYQARRSHHITNHIEAKHMQSDLTYQCDICLTSCPTKNALNAHKSRKHKNTT